MRDVTETAEELFRFYEGVPARYDEIMEGGDKEVKGFDTELEAEGSDLDATTVNADNEKW